MKKVKVASKGYTIEVTSWENDGDNYRTKRMTVESLEEAQKIKKIYKDLFVSGNNGNGGIGNSMDGEGDCVIEEYIEENPEMKLTKEEIDNLSWKLMGGSEFYDYRVCESVIVTYLEEDVYAQEIN